MWLRIVATVALHDVGPSAPGHGAEEAVVLFEQPFSWRVLSAL
jgi:hypothetical protein